MASSSKKRQTMAKIARERSVQERRVRKQERKDERKQAAAEARAAEADGTATPSAFGDDEGVGGMLDEPSDSVADQRPA